MNGELTDKTAIIHVSVENINSNYQKTSSIISISNHPTSSSNSKWDHCTITISCMINPIYNDPNSI